MGQPPSRRRAFAPFAGLLGLAGVAFALTLATNASAAPKDGQAKRAVEAALSSDYLETRFEDAAARLEAAIDACGEKGCSRKVLAQVYVALGTVRAGGLKQLDEAKDAFVEALRLDMTIKPDPALMQTAIKFAFESAREELAVGGEVGRLRHKGVKDHELGRPLPIYIELAPELANDAARVSVSYAPPGAEEFNALDLKKLKGNGYGVEIPCKDVEQPGELRYYLVVTGNGGEILEHAGSESEPYATELTDAPTSPAARFPGYEPAPKCGEQGANALQCVDAKDCNEGLACEGGRCIVPSIPGEDEEAGGADTRTSWIGAFFVPDVAFVSGDDVCSKDGQQAGNFLCLRSDGSRYEGTPTQGNGNNITGGAGLATKRIVLAYDHVLGDVFSLGGRVGFAFGGASGGGASFLPVHLELRGTYWLGSTPFASAGARPYLFLGGGLAQIDTKVSVQVLEDGKACGADTTQKGAPCTKPAEGDDRVEPRKQELEVYKRAGLAFAGGGVGIGYAPFDAMMLDIAVRASVTFPVVTPVISPEVGLRVGF